MLTSAGTTRILTYLRPFLPPLSFDLKQRLNNKAIHAYSTLSQSLPPDRQHKILSVGLCKTEIKIRTSAADNQTRAKPGMGDHSSILQRPDLIWCVQGVSTVRHRQKRAKRHACVWPNSELEPGRRILDRLKHANSLRCRFLR
jgi:hypothetical protein